MAELGSNRQSPDLQLLTSLTGTVGCIAGLAHRAQIHSWSENYVKSRSSPSRERPWSGNDPHLTIAKASRDELPAKVTVQRSFTEV